MKKVLIVLAVVFLCPALRAQQLYNMSLDKWSRQGLTWNPYPKDARDWQRTWDSVNRGLMILGINTMVPEFEHLAVPGPGKAAAKIVSRNIAWGFLTGNLFTGRFVRVVRLSGIEMYCGTPFRGRPKSLSGYYHYMPGVINFASEPYNALKGKTDSGFIEISLYSWPEALHIITNDMPPHDPREDPCLVGMGVLRITEATDGYIHFELPIEYVSDATPSFVGINVLSSALGQFFTGSSRTVLYLDELRFDY